MTYVVRRAMVGIIGGGQLGRMMMIAGHSLGLDFFVQADAADGPATRIASHRNVGKIAPAVLSDLDVVTYESENTDLEDLANVSAPIRPSLRALEVSQDRWNEKTMFGRLGIATPEFQAIDDQAGLETAVRALGLPAVLKTRRFGYDGKGQRVLRVADDVDGAFEALGAVPAILERFVRFDRELSIVAARSPSGQEVFYPLVENVHRDGILRRTIAPARRISSVIDEAARSFARAILRDLSYEGVIALELFESDGALLANEIAPRVHNSGHWTIEGAETSQFENHLRAILDLPLGSTAPIGHSVMLNCIGEMPDAKAVLRIPSAHLHDYGKEPAKGRKLGHVTVRAVDPWSADVLAERVRALVDPG